MTIKSEITLPIQEAKSGVSPNVLIRFGKVHIDQRSSSWDGVWYDYPDKNQLHLRWDQLGSYSIKKGDEVVIHPNEPLDHADLRQPLLGTIMAMILQQRGCLSLHGSAILMNKRVTLFIGNKGEGKSTLAGWLMNQGDMVLSDDVCALTFNKENKVSILPAYAKIKLDSEFLHLLGDNPDNYPQVHPKVTKRLVHLNDAFCSMPQQVGAICTLKTGENLGLEQLNGIDAVKEILSHVMINRFPENQPSDLQKTIFSQVVFLVQQIPVFRLTRPRNLDLLPKTKVLLQQNLSRHAF